MTAHDNHGIEKKHAFVSAQPGANLRLALFRLSSPGSCSPPHTFRGVEAVWGIGQVERRP
jgi:hypothetical protein